MPLSNIPPQADFFYDGKWSQEKDALFLSTLVQLKKEGSWFNNDFPPPSALLTVRGTLKDTFGQHFSYHEINERMKFYHARFLMFKRITNAPETYWDRGRNCIVADENAWTKLIGRANFARVYYHNDEPEFINLSILFGMEDLKTEDDHKIIVISDTPTMNNSPEHIQLATSDSEEVNSPIMPNPRRRRSLFSSPTGLAPAMSSNNSGTGAFRNNITNEVTARAFPTRNFFPGPYVPRSTNDDFTPSSSCASSSPKSLWKNTTM